IIRRLSGQIESDRKPRLTLGQVLPIELVGLFGRRMPRIGAEYPRPVRLMLEPRRGRAVLFESRRAFRHRLPLLQLRRQQTAIPAPWQAGRKRPISLCVLRAFERSESDIAWISSFSPRRWAGSS